METPNIVIELYSGVGRPNTALELTGKKLALFPSRSPPAFGFSGKRQVSIMLT
jgi:hypothetical protein